MATIEPAFADLRAIRTIAVTAIASDDVLMEKLVLKGGNAMALVHRIGSRSSVDLDFAMEDDFADLGEAKDRLSRALADRFDAAGYVVFDYRFERHPPSSRSDEDRRWGGYSALFKIISKERYRRLGSNVDAMRREADLIGPEQQRVFRIDISKHEYCTGKVPASVEFFSCYVYSPAMIAAEKLRAICQQMPEYGRRAHPAPRARDFYDIHALVTVAGVDLATQDNTVLLDRVFAVKEVPRGLLSKIRDQREFHRPDWPSVRNAVSGELREFDWYFDFVVALAAGLHPLGVE